MEVATYRADRGERLGIVVGEGLVDPLLALGGKCVGGDGSETLAPAKGCLRPGDEIECECERIGVLRLRVGTAWGAPVAASGAECGP